MTFETEPVATSSDPSTAPQNGQRSLSELARLFLRMGLTAFGGPAAHIAMFRDEVVTRRKWVTDEHFLDMLGATNLIPGPNSTEMAIHVGYVRAGWRGLIVAGCCFILPAFLIVLVLAALYVNYGSTPTAEGLLYGIKPVIIAVVLQAIWGLLRTAVKTRLMAVVGVVVLGLYLLGFNEIVLLLAGGLLVAFVGYINRRQSNTEKMPAILFGLPIPFLVQTVASISIPISLGTLFLTFLKIGSVLYGSGYVLLAFLRNDFVERLGWLTNKELLDAVSVGQFTPGPVFTTATFIGYLIAGLPGAVLATVGIFLPSFVLVLVSNPFIPRLRRSPFLSALLDGVNVASLGLMSAVAVTLAQNAVVNWFTALLAILSAILLIRFKVNSTWLIFGGGIAGIVYAFLTHAILT